MDFVLGALVMLFGVLVGAAILSTAMARTLPSKNEIKIVDQQPSGVTTYPGNVTIIPSQKEN